MATGDDAIAAGMDVVSGATPANTLDTEVTKTRDYIAQRTGSTTPIPVSRGGTGGATAAAARTNLGIPAFAPGGTVVPDAVPRYDSSGLMVSNPPTIAGHVANKGYVDGVSSRRYKHDIDDYQPADILALRARTFRMNDTGVLELGLIAEEVADVEPLLVRYEDGVPDGVWYQRVAVALLAQVQEQALQIADLTARLDAMED